MTDIYTNLEPADPKLVKEAAAAEKAFQAADAKCAKISKTLDRIDAEAKALDDERNKAIASETRRRF